MFKILFVDKFFIYGIIAIVFTFLNLFMAFSKKNYKIYMFLSLTFTAFTICGLFVDASLKIADRSYLEDVVVFTHKLFWILTTTSIVINSIPMLYERLTNKEIKTANI